MRTKLNCLCLLQILLLSLPPLLAGAMSGDHVYVLELEGEHYYVGRTSQPKARFWAHAHGEGSVWTRMHRPVGLHKFIESAQAFEEERVLLQYMDQFGIDKVRGASYPQLVLTTEQRAQLSRSLANENDLCLRCGRKGHFLESCFAVSRSNVAPLQRPAKKGRWSICSRCSRPGHWEADCYATTDARGRAISVSRDPSDCCYRCGRSGHWEADCYATTDARGRALAVSSSSSDSCYRCGRSGHGAKNCYASTDSSGRPL